MNKSLMFITFVLLLVGLSFGVYAGISSYKKVLIEDMGGDWIRVKYLNIEMEVNYKDLLKDAEVPISDIEVYHKLVDEVRAYDESNKKLTPKQQVMILLQEIYYR